MFQKVNSGGLRGVDGYVVQVEVDVSEGLPGFHLVGYLASEVREAEERVRTAMRNSDVRLNAKKVTVNLSPANVRKEGTGCDLAIAVAVLAAYGIIPSNKLGMIGFIGELGLDGKVKPVKGVLAMVMALKEEGISSCFLPEENLREGLAVEGISIFKASDLRGLILMLKNPKEMVPQALENGSLQERERGEVEVDFSEVNGQALGRRAAEICAAGNHNLLLLGPPGSGKSMISRRIPTIMPALSREEQLSISKIYSICGALSAENPFITKRPFRAPHHTISNHALIGGGHVPRPGEITLASTGVLFLDELTEFRGKTLETLRQPLEDHMVTISRVNGNYIFPADFMLVAATNPCPCGYYPDRNRCSCTDTQVKRYLGKVSRALLDRIDVSIEMTTVSYEDVRYLGENESSKTIQKRVEGAVQIQHNRFKGTGIYFNSQMGNGEIKRYCKLDSQVEGFLKDAFDKLKLSARGCNKVLKVARTISDLDGSEKIEKNHLLEAISYRTLEDKYWGGGV